MDYKTANGPSMIKPTSVIFSQIEGINVKCKTMEEILTSLESKLSPIVNPQGLSLQVDEVEKMPTVSVLSEKLIIFNGNLSGYISRLQSLLDRVEL
jgi:hypothetical protein